MKLVRGSEVNDFLRCRLRWKYAWVDGYKSKKLNDKLFIGTLIHKYLEEWYATEMSAESPLDAMQKLFESTDTSSMDQLELQQMWDMAKSVTEHYDKHYSANPQDIKTVIATELQFAIPLDSEVVYTGTIDLIYLNHDDLLCFEDHKSTKELAKYEKNSDMDRQISRYWWALEQLLKGKGYILCDDQWVPCTNVSWWRDLPSEVFQFVYNILLKAVPEQPELLKKGGLSKNKSQNTTYELYLKAVEQYGLNRDDYNEFLQHLAENGKRFFSRVTVKRNKSEIRSAMREYYNVVKDMDYVKPRLSELAYRNITSDCSWDCSFRDVCHAGMDGSDVQYLLNMVFTKEDINNEQHFGLSN